MDGVGAVYAMLRDSNPGADGKQFSELAYIVCRRGYGPDNIGELKLSEAVGWRRVGSVRLQMLKNAGAVDDLSEWPGRMGTKELRQLAEHLFTAYRSFASLEGQDYVPRCEFGFVLEALGIDVPLDDGEVGRFHDMLEIERQQREVSGWSYWEDDVAEWCARLFPEEVAEMDGEFPLDGKGRVRHG